MERLTYTVLEVVEITGLSRTTISGHIRTGQLPSVKIGGRRMIARSDLELFVSGDPPIAMTVFRAKEEGFTDD